MGMMMIMGIIGCLCRCGVDFFVGKDGVMISGFLLLLWWWLGAEGDGAGDGSGGWECGWGMVIKLGPIWTFCNWSAHEPWFFTTNTNISPAGTG